MSRIVLVCLHGWGGSKDSFQELRNAMADDTVTILTPDLPGFGDEPEPPRAWGTDEYADWVEHWIKTQRELQIPASASRPALSDVALEPVERFFLLGHSHGGRIAIRLAARGGLPIAHLFLCAPAGIWHPWQLKRVVGYVLAKLGRIVTALPGMRRLYPLGRKLLYKLMGVHDYERASPVMQQTLIRVTREDLRGELSEIRIPTDIFWGTDDRHTPFVDGKIIHAGITGSRFHVFAGVRHRVHREKAAEIAAAIRSSSHA